MALQTTNLDDRSFDQLVEVLRKQIPTEDWRDHNPSDPGIMLLELLSWLGEMALYKMNRIPDTHRAKFLDLLIDPPEAATVRVRLTAGVLPGPLRTDPIDLPAGTRLATDYAAGRRYVFETLEPVSFAPPAGDPMNNPLNNPVQDTIEVTARELELIEDERVGTSDGSAGQSFTLHPPREQLGIAEERSLPILVDFVHESSSYFPNPQVRVAHADLSGVIGGKVGSAGGFTGIRFDGTTLDAPYLVTYASATRRMTLARADGAIETAPAMGEEEIEEGSIESIRFDGFGIWLDLDHQFDKTREITIDPAIVTVTGSGAGAAFDAATFRIAASSGVASGVSSTRLTMSEFSTPAAIRMDAEAGFNGTFDGSTPGAKTVTLADSDGNTLDITFALTGAFSGAEQAISVDLHELENLVFVASARWEVRRSLLIEASKVDGSQPDGKRHCTVDSLSHEIHFGDGTFGSIPPSDAVIDCTYRVLRGPEALIDTAALAHLLDFPLLLAGESLTFEHDAAEGGLNFFSSDPDERQRQGLRGFRRRHRLVAGSDFEEVVLVDFNEFDAMFQAAPAVLSDEEIRQSVESAPTLRRALAIMNRKPPLANDEVRRGHVTLLVLPAMDTSILGDDSVDFGTKQALVDLTPELQDRVLHFLDRRRLITTELHLATPTLQEIEIKLDVVVQNNRGEARMKETLRKEILDFLDVLSGSADGKGWPLGRNVYRSEIYQLIEAVDGVDHVTDLTLTPADAAGDAEIAPEGLPVVKNHHLNINLERT